MAKYDGDILELEREELQVAFPDVRLYAKLFACYLVQNKLYDAKFLWKRIPEMLKDENDELKQLNLLLQALICNNILDFLEHIEREWSEEIRTIMRDLLKIAQENVLSTVENAYSSIMGENLIEAIEVYQNHRKQQRTCENNSKEFQTQLICPQKANASSEYQLSRLTGFVSFLEN